MKCGKNYIRLNHYLLHVSQCEKDLIKISKSSRKRCDPDEEVDFDVEIDYDHSNGLFQSGEIESLDLSDLSMAFTSPSQVSFSPSFPLCFIIF